MSARYDVLADDHLYAGKGRHVQRRAFKGRAGEWRADAKPEAATH